MISANNISLRVGKKALFEEQTLMCTGIQPGEALSEKLNVQTAVFQIDPVQVGDLKLSAR